jgi:hypothetical protein
MGRAFRTKLAAAFAAALVAGTVLSARRPQATASTPALDSAQHLFYSGKYLEAIAAAAPLRELPASALAAYELRTSALHFRIKRLLGSAKDKEAAFKQCQACPELLKEFMADVTAGRALARERLKSAPRDEALLYLQAKLDLNEVWLNNSTLGRRKGFGLYKDSRRGVENVLLINPNNVRARVASAWIDYAVDTRVPFGFKWILGGGDRKRALKNMRSAAAMKGGHWEEAEASFGLWEMLVAEKMTDDALIVARQLVVTFPENEELQRFIASGGTKKPPLS